MPNWSIHLAFRLGTLVDEQNAGHIGNLLGTVIQGKISAFTAVKTSDQPEWSGPRDRKVKRNTTVKKSKKDPEVKQAVTELDQAQVELGYN